MTNVGSVSRRCDGSAGSNAIGRCGSTLARRVVALLGAAIAATVVTVGYPAQSFADDAAEAYVECRWQPFADAWGCALPSTFTEGRFGPPPEFKHDAASDAIRQRAYATAKATAGARARGRVGVFVPEKDGAWLFVPGNAWSPGEPVFLPPARTASP
jgi:hypothetical protein